ncbi:MAG TPA: FAD-dependent oxidoreductase [Allosphingosinicella sp.]|nr:FAD-dependent oxidoreductase [Allosphingosinicella sp.]
MADGATDLCIVGGGPAGMVAGLLFARAGVRTIVLEKHGDFLRDFRGDTVHPSTLRIFAELGLLDRLLERPHDKVRDLRVFVGDRPIRVADFSGMDPRWAFIAMMPQWDFLDFVADEARRYPSFGLTMGAQATGLIEREGKVAGVSYRHQGEERHLSARLVIAADGRGSTLRDLSALPLRSLGAPMDVFWFRLPKESGPKNESTGAFTGGRIMALIDRGDYWQCAYVFAKGEAEAIRARGLDAFRADVARVAARIEPRVEAIASWDDVKLLTVALDRLERWHRPGMLVIGDAAHAMSPIGGVGINVAVQDAVAAANILAGPMARGEDPDPLLAKVQARRGLAVRAIQGFQNGAQKRIIAPLLAARGPVGRPALPLRLLARFPILRRLPAAFIGFGVRPEHVRSPQGPRHPGESRDLDET